MNRVRTFLKCGGIIGITKRIHVSVFSFAAFALFYFGQKSVYVPLLLSAALLHELSHLFFLSLFGARVKRITVFPFGIDINADTSRLSYKKELICTLSGCILNLLLASFCCTLLHFFPSPPLLFFTLCNVFLGAFNLIPLSFFDGGKALRLILYDNLDIDKAYYLHRLLDIFSAFAFLVLSFLITVGSDFNLSVICVLIYAALSTFAAYEKKPDVGV